MSGDGVKFLGGRLHLTYSTENMWITGASWTTDEDGTNGTEKMLTGGPHVSGDGVNREVEGFALDFYYYRLLLSSTNLNYTIITVLITCNQTTRDE